MMLIVIISVVVGLFGVIVTGLVLEKLSEHLFNLRETLNRRAILGIDAFTAKHPNWKFDLYRTAASYRMLAMHDVFDPASSDLWNTLAPLKADLQYVHTCRL